MINKQMKIASIIFQIFILSTNLFGQDSVWTRKVCNDILTLSVPVSAEFDSFRFVKQYVGYVNENLYGFQHYDTVINRIENEEDFQISLAGFMHGRMSEPDLKNYSFVIADTAVGGSKGIMVRFKTSDSSAIFKQAFYFVTLANSNFYLFCAYSISSKEYEAEIERFFNGITFSPDKIRESSFVSKSIYSK